MKSWKETAAERRDDRHVKMPEESVRPVTITKDTRKWCRGKAGVPHKLECRSYRQAKGMAVYGGEEWRAQLYANWRVLICSTCGKELETWYGREKNKPEWVT